MEDTPTDQELGFEGIPSMPRGLILPPGAPEEAQEWWIDTMKKVIETDEWKAYLEENYLTEDVRWGEEFGDYVTETQDQFESILKEHGAL
jgi:putative tricarboxylic transport membrane protein